MDDAASQPQPASELHASDSLLPVVYAELRKLAADRLAREKPGQTLQATALVHEAYLRLIGKDKAVAWNSKAHFFGAAAEAMRRILVERARGKAATKRGGDYDRVSLEATLPVVADDAEVIAVHDALDALYQENAVAADLVKLHYFGGFSVEEAGELLGTSRMAAYRLWTFSRAWLKAALSHAN